MPSSPRGLRLVIYDKTQRSREPRALGWSWSLGAFGYRAAGFIDAARGVTSFAEGLLWAERAGDSRPISELQFWGHGKWGRALVERESLDRGALSPTHALYRHLVALRDKLAPNALVWFRTCETLGARAGADFAMALADFMGARVAGHTFEIGFFQSGLHLLAPGTEPSWAETEGLAEGTPEAPLRALPSSPDAPRTITCFSHRVPEEYR